MCASAGDTGNRDEQWWAGIYLGSSCWFFHVDVSTRHLHFEFESIVLLLDVVTTLILHAACDLVLLQDSTAR